MKNMGSLVVRGVLVRLHGARRLTGELGGAASAPGLAAAPPVLGLQTQVAHFSTSPTARAAERNYSAGLPPLDPSLLRPRTPPINYGIRIVPEKTAFVVWHSHCLVSMPCQTVRSTDVRCSWCVCLQVERFGRYLKTLTPGLHFLIPLVSGLRLRLRQKLSQAATTRGTCVSCATCSHAVCSRAVRFVASCR